MSYPQLIGNIVQIQRGIAGIEEVHDHEPGSLTDTPALYNLLDSFQVVQHTMGGKRRIAFSITMRLCLRYNDDAAAEQQLASFIGPILDAFDTNKSLTVNSVRGALTSEVTQGEAGYLPIAAVTYRTCDFTLVATVEQTIQYG